VVELIERTTHDYFTCERRPSIRSFVRGTWVVAVGQHPEIAPFRRDFFFLAGDAIRAAGREGVAS
jgi:hypothetical protein